MIRLLILFLFASSLFAIEHKSDISIKYINYDNYTDETILQGSTELKFENELFKTTIDLEYLYSLEYKERRYVFLNELYLSKEYDEYSFTFGKTIKFWGELEGYNIADVYNQKNYLLDPFSKSEKLGSLGLSFWRYFDASSFEFGLKLYEENLIYPSSPTPYFPLPLEYNKELKTSNQIYTPSLYMVYSFTTEDKLDSESKIIFMHGYDNKRYFINSSQNSLSQYAYRVNKLLFLSHIIYADTIFKCEASYTDVISDEKMSDYSQLSFGIEKSFYSIADVDLGTYLEYYKYIYLKDGKIENVDVSEIYNNDIFLAFKINFNDVKRSEIKFGILYDIENEEKVFKIEAKSRMIDNFELNAEYLQVISSKNDATLLSNLGNSTRIIVGFTYTF